MSDSSAQDRIEYLELKVAYQEQGIKDLSDIVYAHQRSLDRLEELCSELVRQLRSVQEQMPEDGGDEAPPHY